MVNFHQTPRRSTPEHSSLVIQRLKSLKFHMRFEVETAKKGKDIPVTGRGGL
jgi:hypothetical protein